VLLLSSNSTLPSTTNTEIVSALASFAAVTLESRSQRVNLEDLVASRTKALEAALNAKVCRPLFGLDPLNPAQLTSELLFICSLLSSIIW
jgi:hypothetical protein